MHIDARELETDSIIEGDICIVGAGAAGISLALQWINSQKKVILLEAGGFEYEPALQDLYKGKSVGRSYYPLEASRLHYFGGTTSNWAGFCSTLDPIDFRNRSWVPGSGWPITHLDLEKYYPAAHQILELPPYDYSLIGSGNDRDEKPIIPTNDTVWNKLWYLSPPTRFNTKYRNALVNARNIYLYTHANVTNIETNENLTEVAELEVKNLAGKVLRVRAKQFVLACCAMQNARILLASNRQAAMGVGNSNDLVGRNFMEHVQFDAADLLLAKEQTLELYRLQMFFTKRRAELALNSTKQSQLQILNTTAALNSKAESDLKEQRRKNVKITSDSILKQWKRDEEDFRSGKIVPKKPEPSKHFVMFVRVEQAPNPASRITLDSERDALGVPRTVLDWQLTDLEKSSFRKFCEVIGKQVGVMNIGRVKLHEWLLDSDSQSWPDTVLGAFNHMGTTKMSSDPKQGVVDENCKVHGIENLYIAGSSCFPTAGIANPTLPLIALSLRLADHLQTNNV